MDEKAIIAEKYNRGELQAICEHIDEFVARHKKEVVQEAKQNGHEGDLLEALKTLILRRGSIHLPSEMADQIREINNEIWYRGERGDFNRSMIQEEWAMKYAALWRQFRVKEILFVVDEKRDELLRILQS